MAYCFVKTSIRAALAFLAIGCLSCRQTGRDVSTDGDTVAIRYAKGFSIVEQVRYTEVTVHNPWNKGTALARYYLVRNDSIATPDDGTRVRIPIRRLATATLTYFEAIRLLNETNSIVSTSDGELVYSPQILQRIESGDIVPLGSSFNLNTETLLRLSPDALLISAYNVEDNNMARLRRLGTPVLYSVEWQEDTPLGRAEWLRFIAAFYDRLPQADSLFAQIETNYTRLAARVANVAKPRIMSGNDFRGSWNMPTDNSFNATLFRDAGGDYQPPKTDTDGTVSIAVNMETALLQYQNADYWVGVSHDSYAQLAADNRQYTLFKPFRTRRIYSYNASTTPSGGNAYWETAISHPDYLLADFIRVLHPSILPNHKLMYLCPLSQ